MLRHSYRCTTILVLLQQLLDFLNFQIGLCEVKVRIKKCLLLFVHHSCVSEFSAGNNTDSPKEHKQAEVEEEEEEESICVE